MSAEWSSEGQLLLILISPEGSRQAMRQRSPPWRENDPIQSAYGPPSVSVRGEFKRAKSLLGVALPAATALNHRMNCAKLCE